MELLDGEKNFDDMYNRLDSIPACDRQTDRQTSCHGIVRAMELRYFMAMFDHFSSREVTMNYSHCSTNTYPMLPWVSGLG